MPKTFVKKIHKNRIGAALCAIIISEVLDDTRGFRLSSRGGNGECLLKGIENAMAMISSHG